MSAEHRDDPFGRERPPALSLVDSIDDAMPRVQRAPDRLTLSVIVLASVMLGIFVFILLSEDRARLQQARTAPPPRPAPVVAQAAPAPPVAPPPPAPVAPPAPPPQLLPAPVVRPPVVETTSNDLAQAARWKSPSMILDLSGGPNAAPAPGASANQASPVPGVPTLTTPITQALAPPARAPENLSADERFAQRLGVGGSEEPAKATRIANLSTTMQQGALITAVLETAINSDLPGFARAVVSREVRSFDGTRVLVPQGSHVIGQYKSGIALGQSRVFVVWTRLIRPDGASIELASAGTDDLGRGGLEGDVERHFMQRFGGALLLSLVGLTGQTLSDRNTQVVINSTQAGTSAAGVALQQEVNISPTIDVPAGTPLRIFVARDLDFSSVEGGH